MFSLIKDKLQSVQDNIASSFRGLKTSDPLSSSSSGKLPVDLNVGAELLHKYQTEWEEMHMMAEENALAAQNVDVRIGQLHDQSIQQWQTVTQLTSALSSLPKLEAKIDVIISQIEQVQSLVGAVEETLVELADTVEWKELHKRQTESKHQLALYSEQQSAKLDLLRAKLSEEHRQKITQYEKEFEKKQKERQETFAKAFEEDLQTYKQTGKIPTTRPLLVNGPSLEEVELDVDTEALDRLLND